MTFHLEWPSFLCGERIARLASYARATSLRNREPNHASDEEISSCQPPQNSQFSPSRIPFFSLSCEKKLSNNYSPSLILLPLLIIYPSDSHAEMFTVGTFNLFFFFFFKLIFKYFFFLHGITKSSGVNKKKLGR